ncbi:MAG: MFS transporter, partial [Alphaproteobacteria bacterium]
GFYYLIGTLASASMVVYFGGFIDKIRLQVWTLIVIGGLFCACLVFTTAQNAMFMTLGIFMLRFFGQGLMSHTSSASMARYFDKYRGRALAIAGFGEPTYTILLPIPVSLLLLHYDWRFIWLTIAAILCASLALMVPTLLGKSRYFGELEAKNEQLKAQNQETKGQNEDLLKGLTRNQMLKTLRFRLLLPIALVPSFVNTGVVFHHQHLALEKGWGNIGAIFPIFAIVAVVSSVVLGTLVDKFTARKLIWLPMVPMTLAMLVFSLDLGPIAAYVGFGLIGVTSGGTNTIVTAVWPEMFGTKHLGSIRALSATLMVIGSALAPYLMGALFDEGWSTELVCTIVAVISLSAMVCGLVLSRYQAKATWS